jgi:hypothetical protein
MFRAISRRNRQTVSAACCILVVTVCALVSQAKSPKDEASFVMQMEAPPADVLQAVEQVTQDQIIHGTYSYEKERILYGAHSAGSARVFGAWRGEGKVFYKVAENVLAPRNFKDTGDIGTISVRYVVQQIAPTTMTIQIDAVFVDARNVHHASTRTVESSEFAAIQERVKNIDASRRETQMAAENADRTQLRPSQSAAIPAAAGTEEAPTPPATVPELQKQIASLRRQVELRVRDQGAQLKSSPFHSAATLQSLSPETEVVIVILSPYWYGVETEDGHRGWIHHSQLEPLP